MEASVEHPTPSVKVGKSVGDGLLQRHLGGGFKQLLYVFIFCPYLERWSNLTNICLTSWNHQLGIDLDRWHSNFSGFHEKTLALKGSRPEFAAVFSVQALQPLLKCFFEIETADIDIPWHKIILMFFHVFSHHLSRWILRVYGFCLWMFLVFQRL